ncbi:MAG: TonB-dependent receptor [Candidatus Thiodiazotropha sp.]
MKDFGTSKSTKIDSIFDSLLVPRPSRSLTLRDDFASSSPLRCQLPNDWTSRSDAIFGSPLAPTARRVSSIASRLPGTTSLRFAFPGWQRRIGASYQIAQNSSLYSNVSTGFRTPLVDQLYAGDVRGGNYLNNEDIDVQRSINYELGFKGRKALLNTPLQYEVSLFRTDNKDIIGRRDGTYYSGDEMVFDNVGDARNQGLEIWLRSQTMENLTLTLAYTYLKSEVLKHNPVKISYTTLADETYDIVGNELPRTPRHTIDLYATYAITPAWSIIGETYARSGYYADETNMIEMSGYGIFNLQTRYEMHLAKSTLELYAKVNNVFDNQYYKTVFLTNDSNKDDVFDEEDATITVDPGREYYAGLIYRF